MDDYFYHAYFFFFRLSNSEGAPKPPARLTQSVDIVSVSAKELAVAEENRIIQSQSSVQYFVG